MSTFEFFFSFYGLILGLSVAVVLSGFTNTLKQRRRVRIGWLSPLLAVFVLIDIASFWIGAWGAMQDVPIRLFVLVLGLVAAGSYHVAAAMIFPDDFEAWPDLDAYFDSHKQWVMGGVITASLIAFEAMPWLTGSTVAEMLARYTSPAMLMNLFFIGACLVVAMNRNRRLNLAMLVILLFYYAYVAFPRWLWA
ncbi:hypothetical protein [Brevundimonas sp. NIBR11]|uniref:hypothetical protein n=1 Tax=Brevundimonas sp. NIBR11 TaxID=3015999 RepID=UPI0022F06464|nr:hypothetical protein [Brevundimonas sp. NIBR11]WGM29996.1 hypothetical protein KKHFBJBL_00211 [Brevundimonas sp. NIBR11]